jgi:hypothetical protein
MNVFLDKVSNKAPGRAGQLPRKYQQICYQTVYLLLDK